MLEIVAHGEKKHRFEYDCQEYGEGGEPGEARKTLVELLAVDVVGQVGQAARGGDKCNYDQQECHLHALLDLFRLHRASSRVGHACCLKCKLKNVKIHG